MLLKQSASLVRRKLQIRSLDNCASVSLKLAVLAAITNLGPMSPERPSDLMSAAELAAFQEIGIDVDDAGEGPDPVATGVAELSAVYDSALSPPEAASRLGVSKSRIRQRLAEGEIFAFCVNGHLVIPAFQFHGKDLVPGITRVNRALPHVRHPLSRVRWYHTPQPELESGSGRPLTPLEWLTQGGDPSDVCHLAKHLHEYP